MKVFYTLLFLCVAASAKSMKGSDSRVKVTVYYESMCSDSQRFVNDQLYPGFEKLGQYLNISLKPFGKANFTSNGDGWDFTCQHGDAECIGNEMQACILDQVHDPEELVPLINCIMDPNGVSNYPPTAAQQCLPHLGITTTNYDRVKTCAKSVKGQNLLHEIGVETHALSPPLTFVPWILFNDEFIGEDWEASLSDFTGLLCKKYLPGKPECQ